jgi:hypothetical protein
MMTRLLLTLATLLTLGCATPAKKPAAQPDKPAAAPSPYVNPGWDSPPP